MIAKIVLSCHLEMKIQYSFHLFIRKYLITTFHNENIYLPHYYIIQFCKAATFTRYIEVTDSSNYYFFIVVLYRQFKVASRITDPYIAELGISNTIEMDRC